MSNNDSTSSTSELLYDDPSISGPDMAFNNGQVDGYTEEFDSSLPNLTSNTDPDWDITQWTAPGYFDPTNPDTNDTADSDPLLNGDPIAKWSAVSGNVSSGLAVYKSSQYGYTYALTQAGGSNTDVFLQTKEQNAGVPNTFDHQLTFSANERITNVEPNGDNTTWFCYNAFTFAFNLSGKYSVPAASYFAQAVMADNRGQETADSGNGTSLSTGVFNVSNNDTYQDTSGAWHIDAIDAVDSLPLEDDTSFHQVTINLNAMLDSLISALSLKYPQYATYYQDLSDWTLTGSYIGPEGVSSGSTDPSYSATMEVNDIKITSGDSADQSYSAANQKIVQVSDGQASTIKVYDESSVIHLPSDGSSDIILSSYSGSGVKTITVDAEGTDDTINLNGYNAIIDLCNINGYLTITPSSGYENITLNGTGAVNISGSFNGSITDNRTDKGDFVQSGGTANSSTGTDGNSTSSTSSSSNTSSTPTVTDITIQRDVTQYLSPTTDSSTILSLDGGLNLDGGKNVTMVGSYKYFNLFGLTGDTQIASALSGTGTIAEASGTPGITLSSSYASLNVNDSNISVFSYGGELTHTGTGNTTAYGDMGQMYIYGGTDNNIGVSLAGVGALYDATGNIGVSLEDSASNLTLDGPSYDYITAGDGSVTFNNGASGNITAAQTHSTGLYVNANGGQLDYQATSDTNATITIGGGHANLTYDQGYTASVLDMSSEAVETIKGFDPANGEIVLTHLGSEGIGGLSISYENGDALISSAGQAARLEITGIGSSRVEAFSSLGGQDFSTTYGSTSAILALAK